MLIGSCPLVPDARLHESVMTPFPPLGAHESAVTYPSMKKMLLDNQYKETIPDSLLFAGLRRSLGEHPVVVIQMDASPCHDGPPVSWVLTVTCKDVPHKATRVFGLTCPSTKSTASSGGVVSIETVKVPRGSGRISVSGNHFDSFKTYARVAVSAVMMRINGLATMLGVKPKACKELIQTYCSSDCDIETHISPIDVRLSDGSGKVVNIDVNHILLAGS